MSVWIGRAASSSFRRILNMTSLAFLRNLVFLKSLTLENCKKIQTFTHISCLRNLTRLSIRGVQGLHDISFLSNLYNIEVLIIETDALNSIQPLTHLKNIKALALFGRNFVIKDKNLIPIKALSQLSMLDIPNKNCYSEKINNHWDWNDFGKPQTKWLTKK